MIGRPDASEYSAPFADDVAAVPETDILKVLSGQLRDAVAFFQRIPEDRAGFRYAEGKWSLAELVGHVIDCERVYGYRAFVFARGDAARLPGFEQDDYVRASRASNVPLRALAREFGHVRRSNLFLLERLEPEAWARSGVANGARITVRALAYVMAGHVRHHVAIVEGRYLTR